MNNMYCSIDDVVVCHLNCFALPQIFQNLDGQWGGMHCLWPPAASQGQGQVWDWKTLGAETQRQGGRFLSNIISPFYCWFYSWHFVTRFNMADSRGSGRRSQTSLSSPDMLSWNKYVNLFSVMVIYAILSRGNLCHKFTLFCREAFFVGNLRTFECKIFRPQNVLV